jgi:hypothetical protein
MAAMRMIRVACLAVGTAVLLSVAACDNTTSPYTTGNSPHLPPVQSDAKPPSIFGEGGIAGLFDSSKKNQGGGGGGIGVNAYLWRATLDTISFLPLSSADPFGGVIITDWYQPPDVPNERLKLTIFILDRQLRADGVRVSVFRQVRDPNGNWVDAKVDARTATDMEDTILARARELRISSAAASKS